MARALTSVQLIIDVFPLATSIQFGNLSRGQGLSGRKSKLTSSPLNLFCHSKDKTCK